MRILIISPIDPGAIATLRERHDVDCAFNADAETLRERIRGREVVVLRSGVRLTAEAMAQAPELRLVLRAGSGTDNIDLGYLAERGIRLERIPQPGARAVAELAFALMLALARGIRQGDAALRQGHWAKYEIQGRLLENKTLGIIGAGNIGRQVGRLGAAFGMRPLGSVEHPSPAVAAALAAEGIALVDGDTLLAESDFLSLHVPLQASTRNLVDEAFLARVKPGAFLVNLARGGVVDEEALARALAAGDRLQGAALDVHAREGEGLCSPLAELPNVILTPHIGATTVDTQREIGRRIVALVDAAEAEAVPLPALPAIGAL